MKLRVLFVLLGLLASASAQQIPFLFEAEPAAPPNQFIWKTDPGIRYDLYTSDDLSSWDHVDGYPKEATGLSMQYLIHPSERLFFKVVPIDEQAPAIASWYPADSGFGIGRFADISLALSDVTGIDPASISLTVGSLGTFTPADDELSYADGVLTFDSGADVALGAYGEIITVSLAIADTLANSTTHMWTFTLEKDPVVVNNLFVFGSPDAQRAGQRVGATPTRILVPGPMRMADSAEPWTLESVGEGSIVIAYTGAAAPAFAVDTYLCNRTPATLSEIFYRKVVSTADDPVNKKLTITTMDVGLEEIITDGSFSTDISETAFLVGADGTIQRALNGAANTSLPDIGFSLDGHSVTLKNADGFNTANVGFEELHFWFKNGRFRSSVDLGLFDGLRQFEAAFEGSVDAAVVYDVDILLQGASLTVPLLDVSTPSILIPIGPYGFMIVGMEAESKVRAEADTLLTFGGGYRQHAEVYNLGLRYDKPDFTWLNDLSVSPTEIIPNAAALSGNVSLVVDVKPSLYCHLYGVVGAEVALVPSVSTTVEGDTSGNYSGNIAFDLDLEVAPSGAAISWIDPMPTLSHSLIHKEKRLFASEEAAPLAIISQPKSKTVNVGGSARLSCALNRSDGAAYLWYHDSLPIPGQTKSYLDVENIAANHEGEYKVRVRAEGITLWSDVATLTVLNNLADVATYFQYPIGDLGWRAEFPDHPQILETNNLYPGNPGGDILSRADKVPSNGWYNIQDVGSYNSELSSPGIHPGEDWNKIGGDTGEPVYPIGRGTVVKIAPTNSSISSWGWTIVVEHNLATSVRRAGDSSVYYSVYSHLSPRTSGSLIDSLTDESIFPYQTGDSVSMNKPIGYIGDAIAPHLHLEVRRKYRDVNGVNELIRSIEDTTLLYQPQSSNGYWPTSLPLADSKIDFSSVQGNRGWYYGYYRNGNFTQMPNYYVRRDKERWGNDSIGQYFSMSDTSVHPGPSGEIAVRRWVAQSSNILDIELAYGRNENANTSGDGVTLTISKNGTQLWTGTTDQSREQKNVIVESVAVEPGDVIDFTVSPNSADSSDNTNFHATIQKSGSTVADAYAGMQEMWGTVDPSDFIDKHSRYFTGDQTYVLSGTPDGLSTVYSNDRLDVYLNEVPIYIDPDPSHAGPTNAPISFTASLGDTVRVYAYNGIGDGLVGDIYLVHPGSGNSVKIVSETWVYTWNSLILNKNVPIQIP